MKENIPCKKCGKERMIDTSKWSVKRYLDRSPNCRRCATKLPALRKKISKGWFKKGLTPWSKLHPELMPTPWNKGVKGYMGANRTSFTEESTLGDKNNKWKGENVGYYALHGWVYRRLGQPKKCKSCGIKSGRIEWANKSHQYKRDIKDWISLCKKCHGKYDSGKNWGIIKRRFPCVSS
jgi:hypothetical protein